MPAESTLTAGLLAGLGLLAIILVLVPRRLIIEASEHRPAAPLEAGLVGGLIAIGWLAYAAGHWLHGLGDDGLARASLAAVLMILAMIAYVDGRFLVIPDLCSILIALLALAPPFALPLSQALAGAGLCGGLLWAVAWGYKRYSGIDGMGFGDVKLAAAIGALLGVQHGLLAICLAAVGAAAGGIVVGRIRPRTEEDGPALIPYGAALAAAGAGWLIWSRR
ncbi:MAG: pilD [Caulobacteraceae bacterium]|nr:pilD [Caulobacteraceae bacterium]